MHGCHGCLERKMEETHTRSNCQCIYAYFINVFHVPFGDNIQPYKMPFGPQSFNSINWFLAVNTFVAEM